MKTKMTYNHYELRPKESIPISKIYQVVSNELFFNPLHTSLISKMAANKEEPVAAANKEEPASFECFLRRSWPWPPLSKPRRSPRGHPEPKPYIRRAKRQPS